MGKVIGVTPEELKTTGGSLEKQAEAYTTIYKQLLQTASTMGDAWSGEDNQAFVEKINGLLQELESMAKKLDLAGKALIKQGTQYLDRQDANKAQIGKLPG